MDGVRHPNLSTIESAVGEAAAAHGTSAANHFVKSWKLGTDDQIDSLFSEGVRSNAILIRSRLPGFDIQERWVANGDLTLLKLVLNDLKFDPDDYDEEVLADLMVTYLRAYDNAARAVILVATQRERVQS